MKQQQQQAENAAGTQKKKKVTAAQLRVQKGMHLLEPPASSFEDGR